MKLLLCTVFLQSVLAHYGDPYKHGCEKDEVAAQINGIAGKLCIPPCNSDGSCPTDVPSGVTATPKCVLKSSTGSQYCALVCTPAAPLAFQPQDAQCGTHASCKKATSNGLCTYDDAPLPPSSAHWKPVSSPTFDALGEALNVAFTSDGVTGYVGAGTNGVGPQIMKSVDSGITWNQVWPDSSNSTKFDLLLASAVKSADEAVVTGVLFQLHTDDGKTFKSSINEFLTPSQDAKVIPAPSSEFAIAVAGNKNNGVATSKDGTAWKTFTIPANASIYPARYGAYPTASTWYLTAGSFPTNNTAYTKHQLVFQDQDYTEPNLRHLSHKVAVDTATYQVYPKVMAEGETEQDPVPCTENPDDCFSAGIFKTTDAGKSWKQVVDDTTSNFYPNGIDCFGEDHCISVVEGSECQILVTRDGGASWNATLKDTDSKCSLTYVAMLSDKEAWVGGGHMAQMDFEGRFWHTTDGGATWTKEAIKGLYIFDLDMTSPTSGYAVALTISSGTSLLKYDPSGRSSSN
jgi:photosystem II stability/assembly factor-like uncharacterized protein